MTPKQEIIIAGLKAINRDVTTKDLFEIMTAAEKENIGDETKLSSALCKLRDAGLIENGISEIVQGKTRLTWHTTQAGIDELTGQAITNPPKMSSDHIADVNKMVVNAPIDIESVKRDLIDALDRWYTGNAQPQINDIELKIDTLRNLAPMLSTDISDVLMNIADDLEGMEKRRI
ncbi:MAG: hypothetical protein IBX56_09200 [Methylomicrobium sp.]|nr:hypothetical protein [Methylomicrobium sp.]